MRLYTLILIYVSICLAGYVTSTLIGLSVLVGNQSVMPYTSGQILAEFNLATFATMGIGAGIAGLVGVILRQYTFALLAAVIWVVGLMFTVGQWFLNGIPMLVSLFFAGTGLESVVLTVLTAGFTMFLFFSFASILSSNPQVSP